VRADIERVGWCQARRHAPESAGLEALSDKRSFTDDMGEPRQLCLASAISDTIMYCKEMPRFLSFFLQ
jgi:hypothetical protein